MDKPGCRHGATCTIVVAGWTECNPNLHPAVSVNASSSTGPEWPAGTGSIISPLRMPLLRAAQPLSRGRIALRPHEPGLDSPPLAAAGGRDADDFPAGFQRREEVRGLVGSEPFVVVVVLVVPRRADESDRAAELLADRAVDVERAHVRLFPAPVVVHDERVRGRQHRRIDPWVLQRAGLVTAELGAGVIDAHVVSRDQSQRVGARRRRARAHAGWRDGAIDDQFVFRRDREGPVVVAADIYVAAAGLFRDLGGAICFVGGVLGEFERAPSRGVGRDVDQPIRGFDVFFDFRQFAADHLPVFHVYLRAIQHDVGHAGELVFRFDIQLQARVALRWAQFFAFGRFAPFGVIRRFAFGARRIAVRRNHAAVYFHGVERVLSFAAKRQFAAALDQRGVIGVHRSVDAVFAGELDVDAVVRSDRAAYFVVAFAFRRGLAADFGVLVLVLGEVHEVQEAAHLERSYHGARLDVFLGLSRAAAECRFARTAGGKDPECVRDRTGRLDRALEGFRGVAGGMTVGAEQLDFVVLAFFGAGRGGAALPVVRVAL